MLPNEHYHTHDYQNFDDEDEGVFENKLWDFCEECLKYMYKEVRKRKGVVVTNNRIYAICPQEKGLIIATVVNDKGYMRWTDDMSPYEIIKLTVSLEQHLKKSSDPEMHSKYFNSGY